MREHYLRDDIYCGAPFCKVCDTSAARLSDSASTVLVPDTNVVLNQVNSLRFASSLFCVVTKCYENFLLFAAFENCLANRLICWRIRPLMMSSCYLLCWMRLRTRILLFTTA